MSFAAGLFFILAGITIWSFGIISNFLIIFLLIFGGFSLLIIFGLIQKYISKEYPMFHFSLFKIKTFLGGNIAIFLNSIVRGNFIFLISIYLQGALMNLSPVETGTYLIPVFVTLAIFGPLSGWLSDTYSSRFFSALCLFISVSAFYCLPSYKLKQILLNYYYLLF